MTGSTDPFAGDLIEVTGLRVFGHHGVLASEQRDGQVFVVDAVLAVDHGRAAASDALVDTVHYGEVTEELAEAVASTRFDLIEALAGHLAGLVLARPGVHAVRIRVHKPAAPVNADFADVAVVVVRP